MGAGSMARWVQIMKAETFIFELFTKYVYFKSFRVDNWWVQDQWPGGCRL